MEITEGTATSLVDWCTVENTLFTYSEEEKEENRINKANAELVLRPKFIPVYPSMLEELSLLEATVYGFIDFFLGNNEKFYCTNEQIAEMLHVGTTSVSNAVTTLKEKWLIDLTYKIRSGGWKTRIIRLTKSVCPTYKICKSDLQNLYNIENNIIENKKEIYKEKKSIPSVSELVEAYKNNPLLVEKIWDVDVVRERAEYKQAKKNRAYKTVSWFIQQLVVCVETVRFWMPRGDTAQRLRFALNQTCEREWKSVYWNETIEQEYQSWKRNLALTLNKWTQI